MRITLSYKNIFLNYFSGMVKIFLFYKNNKSQRNKVLLINKINCNFLLLNFYCQKEDQYLN